MSDHQADRPGFPRGTFLKGVAAAGIGAFLPLFDRSTANAGPSGLSPLDLVFSVKNVHRPFELLGSRFTVLDDRFGHDTLSNYEMLAPDPDLPVPALTVGHGRLAATGDGPTACLLRSGTVQRAPFSVVIADIASFAEDAVGEDVVQVGLVKDAANYLVGCYDNTSTAITIDACVDGTVVQLAKATGTTVGCRAGAVNATLTTGHTLGQSFTVDQPFISVDADFSNGGSAGSQVTMSLYQDGPGGRLVASRRITLSTDSTWWRLDLDPPAPAGTYYLEQSDPVGTPGWWSSATDGYPDGQSCADGRPVDGDRLFTVSLVDPLAAPASLAFCHTGDSAAVYVCPAGGDWTLTASATTTSVLDLRPETVFPGYHNAAGFRSAGGTTTITRLRAGYFGQTGVRDDCVVTYPDGTPYIRDNRLYLTATAAGPAISSGAAHLAVFALNLADYNDFTAVGRIYFRRDGLVVGDAAGKIVVDPTGNGAKVFASTWGTPERPGVDITLSAATEEVLHGVTVADGARTIWANGYDPDPTRIDGKWYMPIAGVSMVVYDNDDFTNPSSYPGQEPGLFEGPRLQKVGGRWYVFYGGVRELRVYDLDLTLLGHLDAPHPNAPDYPLVNPPHLMVTPIPQPRGETKFILVTFNGHTDPPNIGLGELVVMEAVPTERGYEFPPHKR